MTINIKTIKIFKIRKWIKGNKNIARPGGRVIVSDGKIVRYTQDDVVGYLVDETPILEYQKQCALIAVDELIYETQFEVPNIRQKYWIEVKQEIENL